MDYLVEFASANRYLILFATVFAAQLAMFVPIVPVLLATGALIGQGSLRGGPTVFACVAGVLSADLIWYELGRRQGARVLGVACKVAQEPESCVRRAERVFARFGARTLLVARFIPGLITATVPLAGLFRMYLRRFVLYDALGTLLWVGTYVVLGLTFAETLTAAGRGLLRIGQSIGIGLAAAFTAYLAWRYLRRQRFLRRLRVPRATPEEVHRKMQAADSPTIVDLRHPIDVQADPHTIPGALVIPAEELHRRSAEIPEDREIVLCCTCPKQATSAREALRLRARGIIHVRPLAGGLPAWRERGFPVESLRLPVPNEALALNAD